MIYAKYMKFIIYIIIYVYMYLHTHTYDKFGTFVISFTSFFIFSFFFFFFSHAYILSIRPLKLYFFLFLVKYELKEISMIIIHKILIHNYPKNLKIFLSIYLYYFRNCWRIVCWNFQYFILIKFFNQKYFYIFL